MALPSIDWKTADVRDGTLTVDLAGERPKGWKKSFASTARLLGGQWAAAQCQKGQVTVPGVRAGDEDRLRHFLEGVVLQANAGHEAPEEESADGADEETPDQPADDPDAELTARFRAFAD